MQKSTLSRTLRAIAAAMDTLDAFELDALVSGKGKLVFVADEKGQGKPDLAAHNLGAIIERLDHCKDREQARRVLDELANKDALSSLARTLKIHVLKSDRREDIEHKIIEFVIGGKLRSAAIQGLNMNGGGAKPASSSD